MVNPQALIALTTNSDVAPLVLSTPARTTSTRKFQELKPIGCAVVRRKCEDCSIVYFYTYFV